MEDVWVGVFCVSTTACGIMFMKPYIYLFTDENPLIFTSLCRPFVDNDNKCNEESETLQTTSTLCSIITQNHSCSSHASNWLPIKYCIIMYNILSPITFKCFHGLAPDYLADLIQKYKPSRNLRSSSRLYLVSPSVSTISYRHCSFHYAAPELWKDLPYHIKHSKTLGQFKSSLKIHLFALAFSDY